MEILSTLFIIFAVAFGINPYDKSDPVYTMPKRSGDIINAD